MTTAARPLRPPVQKSERWGKPPGTVTWDEHFDAWTDYAKRFGHSQSAERIAERGGFSYGELVDHLGHEPRTWEPR